VTRIELPLTVPIAAAALESLVIDKVPETLLAVIITLWPPDIFNMVWLRVRLPEDPEFTGQYVVDELAPSTDTYTGELL
jgi:hypothetical protein